MKKRLVAILLVLIMALAVTGCGGSNEPATSGSPSASSSGSTATGEPIQWGGWTYLTGASASLGVFVQNGMELGIQHINERGGINGRPVELTILDNGSSADQTGQIVTRLVEQNNAKAIIGAGNTPALLTYKSYLEENGIPNTYFGTSAGFWEEGDKFTFRTTGSAAQTDRSTFEAMQEMGAQKIAMLAVNSEYGTLGVEQYSQWCSDAGIDFVSEFYTVGDTDFTGQIAKLVAEQPDAFLAYASTGLEITNMVRQLRRTGWTTYVFGTESCSSVEYRDVGGDDVNGTVYFTTCVIPDELDLAITEQEKQFLIDYKEKYGDYPQSDVAYRAYDSVMLMALAFENAEDINDPDSLSEAFFNISGYEGIQGTFDYTSRDGEGLHAANGYVVHEGKNIPLETYKGEHDITKPYGEG